MKWKYVLRYHIFRGRLRKYITQKLTMLCYILNLLNDENHIFCFICQFNILGRFFCCQFGFGYHPIADRVAENATYLYQCLTRRRSASTIHHEERGANARCTRLAEQHVNSEVSN